MLMIVIVRISRVPVEFLLATDAQQHFIVRREVQCVYAALMAEVRALQSDFVQIFGNEKFLQEKNHKRRRNERDTMPRRGVVYMKKSCVTTTEQTMGCFMIEECRG